MSEENVTIQSDECNVNQPTPLYIKFLTVLFSCYLGWNGIQLFLASKSYEAIFRIDTLYVFVMDLYIKHKPFIPLFLFYVLTFMSITMALHVIAETLLRRWQHPKTPSTSLSTKANYLIGVLVINTIAILLLLTLFMALWLIFIYVVAKLGVVGIYLDWLLGIISLAVSITWVMITYLQEELMDRYYVYPSFNKAWDEVKAFVKNNPIIVLRNLLFRYAAMIVSMAIYEIATVILYPILLNLLSGYVFRVPYIILQSSSTIKELFINTCNLLVGYQISLWLVTPIIVPIYLWSQKTQLKAPVAPKPIVQATTEVIEDNQESDED